MFIPLWLLSLIIPGVLLIISLLCFRNINAGFDGMIIGYNAGKKYAPKKRRK